MKDKAKKWHVLIGTQKYGPYTYGKMIEMLQANELMDYNYVWNESLENWTPIYQLEEFSKDRFQLILKSDSELQPHFTQRTSDRIEKKIPFIGHNNIRFFDGEIMSISEGGALCMINSPLPQVGDNLKLHIQIEGAAEISFNIEAKIIRKLFVKKRLNSKSGLHYAIRFEDVQHQGLQQIRNWLSKAA
jgi:hypothetical protein